MVLMKPYWTQVIYGHSTRQDNEVSYLCWLLSALQETMILFPFSHHH